MEKMPEMTGSGTANQDKQIHRKKSIIKGGPEVFQEFLRKGDEGRIIEDDFVEIYGKEAVERDKERVRNFMLSKDYQPPTSASIVLENVINEIGESGQWFSTNRVDDSEYYSARLAKFDDTMADSARADVLFEKEMPDGKIMRLLIDVTTSVDEKKRLYEKKQKSIENIKKGRLHSIKYFQSRITDEMGRKSGLPMVIIGIDKNTLHGLCERIASGKSLSYDCVSFMLLDEIVSQLGKSYSTSFEINGEDHPVTKELQEMSEFFSSVLEEKESLRPKDFREKAGEDGVYSYLSS